MRPNPLIAAAASERHGECCAHNACAACGAHVSGYDAKGGVLIAWRPDSAGEDWWYACDNADCEHAYGEGFFQFAPDWVITDEADGRQRSEQNG